jgi:transposase
MVDHIDHPSEPRGRVDIRVGVGRRRRWSVATKGRIVAESYAPGAVVSGVARRHDMSPQHLFGWRKAARASLLKLPADEGPMFVPIVREARDDGVAAAVGVTVSGGLPSRLPARWFARNEALISAGCGMCCVP